MTMTTFAETHDRVQTAVEGWLHPSQARCLWDLGSTVGPGGTIVEIGSYQGKSTVMLAAASDPEATVYAIDPHAGNDRAPGEWEGSADDGQSDHDIFIANLESHGVRNKVEHVREFSQDAHPLVPGTFDVLYVDGAHGYKPACSDIDGWGSRVNEGGLMAIHDCYASFFVTLALIRLLWWSNQWTYVERHRSMTVYRKVAPENKPSNLARQAANMPWFFKNMVAKAAGFAGLKPVEKLLTPSGGMY
jgi:predicted O-methyltransferase YrrM